MTKQLSEMSIGILRCAQDDKLKLSDEKA
jgi:hypothetical protein